MFVSSSSFNLNLKVKWPQLDNFDFSNFIPIFEIINKNVHAISKSSGARKTITSSLRRISGEIQARINSSLNSGFLSGVGHGIWSRIKQA